jgi:large subunit ribosomal protein L25
MVAAHRLTVCIRSATSSPFGGTALRADREGLSGSAQQPSYSKPDPLEPFLADLPLNPSSASPLQSAAVSGDRTRLDVKERANDELGSRHTRRLRKQGLIPGVLYGKGTVRAIVVGERELRGVLTGSSGLHAILDVVIEGQTTPHHAVLKDFQQNPIRGTITHVDFHEVRLDQPIHASVAVQFVGESPGVKQGGVLQQVTRELNVEALPGDIPEHVEADLSGLEIGGAIRLEDLPAVAGVAFLDDPHETVLATCTVARGLAELEAAEAEEAEGEEGAEGEAPDAEGSAEAPADTEE